MSQHVPAWKKVGLKLKYAKDTADDATGQQQPSSDQVSTIGASENAGKRSRDEDGEAQDGHVKKRRTDSKAKASPQHASSNVTSTTGTVPSNSLNGSADYEGSTPSRTKSSPLPAQQATVDNTK